MKTKNFLLIGLSVLLFNCNTEEEIKKSSLWGIDFSEQSTTGFAQGTIDLQHAESKTTYVVNEGSLRQSSENDYTISFAFENGESLQLTVSKKTSDANFYYPGSELENQLRSATFNGEVLSLKESSIAIQPRLDENKVWVTANIQTSDATYFKGTLTRVPLLE